ncbi:PHP domain-containing protein [Thermococcus piezophilus]|uniref:Polymerase/histidinol phosphatase N-terminal domain-containing protein n=1 Tax=Thermococcus piezophilus TaxID=1712654 RepID=A0A172WER3_9EURY|nr:PHP domain-containing protein [Thermococcus piezophilus]ANF21913.1 hypothetical protein A7C91_00890 [Thermococcus piezophilus]
MMDMHTHTSYSDGVGTILENLAEAERKGLRLLGISDHIHYFTPKSFNAYLRDINTAGKDSEIVLLSGIEANIEPNGQDIVEYFAERLDYIIASVHRWVETPREYIELVKTALMDDNVDVIGHFGANFPYIGYPSRDELMEILELAEANGKAFEISSRYRVPELDFVRECIKRGIKLTFASDAHWPKDVGNVSWSEKVFRKAGGRKEDLLFSELL